MALVICDMSMSLDGFVTGPNDSRENPFGDGAGTLHDWLFNAPTDADLALLREACDSTGAIVMGRRSFDKCVEMWGTSGPLAGAPCFVVTHHEPAESYPAVYTFVTDGVASAITLAREAAGDKVVGLHGATVMQQCLPLGLLDGLVVHVVTLLIGGGTRLFDALDSAVTLERTDAVVTPAATHLRFRVVRARSGTGDAVTIGCDRTSLLARPPTPDEQAAQSPPDPASPRSHRAAVRRAGSRARGGRGREKSGSSGDRHRLRARGTLLDSAPGRTCPDATNPVTGPNHRHPFQRWLKPRRQWWSTSAVPKASTAR